MTTKTALRALTVAGLLLGSGCGLEGLINEFGGNQWTQPVSVIRGTVPLAAPKFVVLDVNDNKIPVFAQSVDGSNYEVQLISGDYSAIRLQAIQGEAVYEAFVPSLAKESTLEGVNLDVNSTASVLLIEGLIGENSPSGKTLPQLSADLICIVGKKVQAKLAEGGAAATMLQMMQRIEGRANLEVSTSSLVFQTPSVDASFNIVESPFNPNWIARTQFDYDANGVLNQTTDAFDAEYKAVLQTLELSAPPDPSRIRVVFEVNFNAGQLSGTCQEVNRFKWVRDSPGKKMYFVGGIHKTSPVQDPEIDAMLGNRGGWTPNQIQMYDDGTHGDRAAADGIWTVTFDLPHGLRLGYKYTWGHQGDLWTGTEEWPGNQRILELTDENSDGYIYRIDNFGDEASNKDLSNLNPVAAGSLDWNEDLNGDGIPEAHETPGPNACAPYTYQTPDWVPPLTVSCEQFVP